MRLSSLLVMLICWAGAGSSAVAADNPADELKTVRSRIEALEKQIQSQEESRQEAVKAVKSSDKEVNDARKRLKEILTREKVAQEQLKTLYQQRTSINGSLDDQRTVLSKLVYQQYLGGAPESLQLILSGKDANQVSRQLQYLTYVSKSRGRVIADLRENLAQLENVTNQTAGKKKELETLHAEAEHEKKRLEKERTARQGVLKQVSTEIRKTQEEIEILKKNEQRLATLVAHLARELARKSKQTRRKNHKTPEPIGDVAFNKLKGKLHLPVIGEVVSRYGSPRADTGLSWKGLVIATRTGEPIKAIAAGEVAYADSLRGFGKLIIVDHGEGYMSLYGYNQSLTRKVGDKVDGGDTIGVAGMGDGVGESGLYFEMRVQGKTVDPMKWMAR